MTCFFFFTPLTAYAIDQDYNITIADKDGSTTVGVDITTENYEDVLGDGTVSYDPTTNTLTLNNYVYNGEGLGGDGVPCAITADTPIEGLTIVLVGTNSITVSGAGGSESIRIEKASFSDSPWFRQAE